MRSFSVVVFALVLATGLSAPLGNGTDNKVQDLIDAYLAYVEGASAKVGTIRLKDLTNLPIVTISPPVGILLSATNRTLSGLSNNVVSNVSVVNNTAQYTVTFPDIKMQSDCKVNGLAYGRPTSGQGPTTLDLALSIDVSVTLRNVDVQWPLVKTPYLQIAELSERYSLQGVATNVKGLTVLGLSEAEVETLLNAQITTALTLNLPIWSKIESAAIKSQLNLALVGSTIDDAINWLKNNKSEPSVLYSFIPSL